VNANSSKANSSVVGTLLPKSDFGRCLLAGLRLLSRKEVKIGAGLMLATMAAGMFEMLALTGVLPLVNVVMQPASLQSNGFVAQLYRIAGTPDVSMFITLLGLAVIILMTVSAITNWVVLYAQNRYAASCQKRLAQGLIDKCLQAPYSWFLTRNSTRLARVVYDDTVFWGTGFVQRLIVMANSSVTVIMALTLVLVFSPWTGMIALTTVGLLACASFYLTRPFVIRLSMTKRQASNLTAVTATQVLSAIKDIKLSSRENYFSELFKSTCAREAGTRAKLTVFQETPNRTIMFLGQLTLVIVALFLWNKGTDPGEIAAQLALLIIVTSKAIPAFNKLSSGFGSLWNAFPHIEAIHEIFESIETDLKRGATIREPGKRLANPWRCISFERVGYQYPDSQEWAVRDLQIRIERGGSYGIVGRSAAGKSTMVDLLVGLLRPTTGTISVDGNGLENLDLQAWQELIGYVPQTPYIIDDTLRANVAFGLRENKVDDDFVVKCLRLANLEIFDWPEGLDTMLGDRGLRLSGGQRQRIAVARALYKAPEILVFDEATSALDSITEAEMLASLTNLQGHITLITIAHRLTTVMLCDQIFLLERGRLVGQGTYTELRGKHSLFQSMATGLL
jgi:ABC-type multidrug transport system fused ATPase/permease subunit